VIDDACGPLGAGTPDDPRLVIESWMALRTPAGWRVLMLRRAPDHGGFWQGVSGRVETCDASLRAAALREIREETGIGGGVRVFDLGRWIDFRGLSGTHFRKRSLGAVVPPETRPEALTLCEEHDAAEVVTFDEARARVRWPQNVEELRALEAELGSRGLRSR
jgi:8-oxo-dGTP pyrophosphatase MutT (NUDIX family)